MIMVSRASFKDAFLGPSDLDIAVGLWVGQEPLGFPLKAVEVHLGHVASVAVVGLAFPT